MAYSKLIAFDRPLSGIAGAGIAPPPFRRALTETEVAAREEAAYHRGVDEARAKVDRQLVELRADMQQLSEGVLTKIGAIEPLLVAQVRDALPALALDLARRLIAGYEPPPEVVAKLCEEALGELFPERENLELVVSPRDAELLASLDPSWKNGYPGLRIRPEPTLVPGDCQVRSRFGLIDARLKTKLEALEHHLMPA